MFGISITSTGLAVEAANTSIVRPAGEPVTLVAYPKGVLEETVLGCVLVRSAQIETLKFDSTHVTYPHLKDEVKGKHKTFGNSVDLMSIRIPNTPKVAVLYTSMDDGAKEHSQHVRGIYIPDGEQNGLQFWRLQYDAGRAELSQSDLPHTEKWHAGTVKYDAWLEVHDTSKLTVELIRTP